MAFSLTVRLQPGRPRLLPGLCKLVWYFEVLLEIHFVWSAASVSTVRQDGVVFCDIDAYSARNRSPVPRHADRRFQSKPISGSIGCRSTVPGDADQNGPEQWNQ